MLNRRRAIRSATLPAAARVPRAARPRAAVSELPMIADIERTSANVCVVPQVDSCAQQIFLFDHLVGAYQEGRGHHDSECRRSFVSNLVGSRNFRLMQRSNCSLFDQLVGSLEEGL